MIRQHKTEKIDASDDFWALPNISKPPLKRPRVTKPPPASPVVPVPRCAWSGTIPTKYPGFVAVTISSLGARGATTAAYDCFSRLCAVVVGAGGRGHLEVYNPYGRCLTDRGGSTPSLSLRALVAFAGICHEAFAKTPTTAPGDPRGEEVGGEVLIEWIPPRSAVLIEDMGCGWQGPVRIRNVILGPPLSFTLTNDIESISKAAKRASSTKREEVVGLEFEGEAFLEEHNSLAAGAAQVLGGEGASKEAEVLDFFESQ